MVVILIRTLIVYAILLVSMRLMGKRQIGQLELTDFITTLLLSEIASVPIENPDVPIVNALIPFITLLTFEVVSSTLLSRSQKLKNLFSTRPGILIRHGKPDQQEIMKNRISLDELLSELRQKDITDISDVAYAILEQDGKLTVIPQPDAKTVTLKDLKIHAKDEGVSHIVVSNGTINRHGLKTTGRSSQWVEEKAQKLGCSVKDIFLMTVNDTGKVNVVRKEQNKK